MLCAFLRLRVEPGGYRKLYANGLSHCGKLVMDTLTQAGYLIVRKIFITAAYSTERAIARIFNIDQALVEGAARKLERERIVTRGVRIDGHPGATSVLSGLMS